MSLSSLIVQRDVATMRQVEEALARQVIYGGDLVTNLLEVARVDEAILTPLLAESMHLSAAPSGELPPPPESVRALISAELAVQRSLVPLEASNDRLVLAVVEPLPAEVRDQLSQAIGLRIDEVAAPAVRVWQAVARAYGVQLERRMQRLIGRISGDPTVTGSLPPLGASVPPAAPPARSGRPSRPPPRPAGSPPTVGALAGAYGDARPTPDGRPSARRRATLTSFPAVRGPAEYSSGPLSRPEMAAATTSSASIRPSSDAIAVDRHALLQRPPSQSLRPTRRRRGPLTLDAARAEAEEVTDRDGLLDLFFDFSRQFFDYAVLFLVQADIAEGRDAFGSGASRERVLGIGVPLDLPGLLASAREKRLPLVATAAPDGLDAQLLADMHRPPGAGCWFITPRDCATPGCRSKPKPRWRSIIARRSPRGWRPRRSKYTAA